MSEEMLRGEHLSKSFGRVTALKDTSIRLEKGEVLGLLGDNGAGCDCEVIMNIQQIACLLNGSAWQTIA